MDYAQPTLSRPRVELCMISTCDGATEAEGRSGVLGGPADLARLIGLRAVADVVLVGAGTVRAERYGPPSKAGLRIAVVTRSCDLDFDSPLFASGAGFVVTTTDAPDVPVESVRAGRDEIDFAAALIQLEVDLVHVEGGPRLNAHLLAADVVDAIHLTFAPHLTGARGRSIAEGAFDPRRFTLADAEVVEGFVFARYERVRNA